MNKAGQYGEPWRYLGTDQSILFEVHDANDNYVMQSTHTGRGRQERRHMRRATAAVNACAGLSDEQLSQNPIAKAREALHNMIGLASPFFTDETQMLALSEARAALALLGDKP